VKSNPPEIRAGPEGVVAAAVCDIVGDLIGTRIRISNVVPADGRKTSAVRKIDGRKTAILWMIGHIHVIKTQLVNSCSAYNCKVRTEQRMGKAKPEFV